VSKITSNSASFGLHVFSGRYPRRRDCHRKDLKHIYGADEHVHKSKRMVINYVVISATCTTRNLKMYDVSMISFKANITDLTYL
jgi:hypothetical protein